MAKLSLRPDLDITRLWRAARTGDQEAVNILMEELYEDLKACAHGLAMGEPPSVSTRALVSEVYLRIVRNVPEAEDREHIRRIISRVMRNILCDWGRARRNPNRAGFTLESLDYAPNGIEPTDISSPVDEQLETRLALERLEESDPELSDILQMHELWGMTLEEIESIRGTPKSTVHLRLKEARVKLRKQARVRNFRRLK